MKHLFILASSIFLLISCNSDDDFTATAVRINRIEVSNIPSVDINGDQWESNLNGTAADWQARVFIDDGDGSCHLLNDNVLHVTEELTDHGISNFNFDFVLNIGLEDISSNKLGIMVNEMDVLGHQWLSCETLPLNFHISEDKSFIYSYTESSGVTVDIFFEKI